MTKYRHTMFIKPLFRYASSLYIYISPQTIYKSKKDKILFGFKIVMGSKGNRVLPWLPCHPFRLWTWFRMSQTADHQDKIYQWALHHLTLGGCQRDLKSKQESVILVSRSEQPPRETSLGTCQPLCTRLIQLNSAIWPALMRKEVKRSMEPTHTENQLQEDIPYILLLT